MRCLYFLIIFIIKYVYSEISLIPKDIEKVLIENVKLLKFSQNPDFIKLKEKNPKISVVILVSNATKYLTGSLHSVQFQTLQEIEIILVDEESTSRSFEYLKDLKYEDRRIRILKRGENKGSLFTKMHYAFQCKGEYIIFLEEQDVYVDTQFLENLYKEAAKNHSLDFMQYNYYIGNYDGKENISSNYIVGLNPEKINNVLDKPEVADFYYKSNETEELPINNVLYNKLFSNKLIKKIFTAIGDKILFKENLTENDNFIICAAAFAHAENFMSANLAGLWHWQNNPKSRKINMFEINGDNLANPSIQNRLLYESIKSYDVIFDLTKDDPRSLQFNMKLLYSHTENILKAFARSDYMENLYEYAGKIYHSEHNTEEGRQVVAKFVKKAENYEIKKGKKKKSSSDDEKEDL